MNRNYTQKDKERLLAKGAKLSPEMEQSLLNDECYMLEHTLPDEHVKSGKAVSREEVLRDAANLLTKDWMKNHV